jgi:hypothetical protein
MHLEARLSHLGFLSFPKGSGENQSDIRTCRISASCKRNNLMSVPEVRVCQFTRSTLRLRKGRTAVFISITQHLERKQKHSTSLELCLKHAPTHNPTFLLDILHEGNFRYFRQYMCGQDKKRHIIYRVHQLLPLLRFILVLLLIIFFFAFLLTSKPLLYNC